MSSAAPKEYPSLATLRHGAAKRLALVSDSPDLDACRLLTHAAGISNTQLITESHKPVTTQGLTAFERALARRLAGEPLAYITGHIGFHEIELQVSPDVLIPRPDSEALVNIMLESLPANRHLTVADLGTGSGAIALALATARPCWTVLATDISAPALACARKNARSLALSNVHFLQGYWLAPLALGELDAIVSNPPYIDATDPHLTDLALRHEPRGALVAGDNGLADIACIATQAPFHLKDGGLLAVEHGYNQKTDAQRLFQTSGLCNIRTIHDLGGNPRVTLGERRQVGQATHHKQQP